MMKNKFVVSMTLLIAALVPWRGNAATFNFSFAGSGVSGIVQLTYGTATDAKYPQAYEVTGISGTFTDLNNGLNIVNAPIASLVPIVHSTPEPTNLLAPNDFSRFAVAAGLPSVGNGFITYDNLLYPGGSPQTGSDYPFYGGVFDVYGLLFNIGGGRVVDLWSNGDLTGTGAIDYGAAVATANMALDYPGGGVSATPEPGTIALLGCGLAGMVALRLKRRLRRSH